MRRIPGAVVIVTVAIVTMSGVAGAKVQPKTAQDLAAMITAKDLDCRDFTEATHTATVSTPSEGTCTVWHEAGVTLDVFVSRAALRKAVSTAPKAICATLKQAHSSQKIVLVVGTNWTAVFESTVNAHPLASALQAKTQPINC